MGDHGDRQQHHGEEPRATLPSTDSAREHDHGDARHRGDGRRGGHYGERQDREHQVQVTAQGVHRGDRDVEQSVEENEATRPPAHPSLTMLFDQTLGVLGEGPAVGPRRHRFGHERRLGLNAGPRDEALEQRATTTRRLTREQAHLQGAGGFDFDDAHAVEGTKDGRQAEATATFDHDGPGRSRRRTHAVVEEGQRGARGTADDGAGAATLDDPAGDFEGVDAADRGEGEGLAERVRGRDAGVASESSAHDDPREARDEGLHDGDDHEIEEQVDPEVMGVQDVHAVVTVRQVTHHRRQGTPEVEECDGKDREPDPTGEAAVEHTRRDETLDGRRVLESARVGAIGEVDGGHVELVGAGRDREVAHPARGRYLQHEIGGQGDAEGLQ